VPTRPTQKMAAARLVVILTLASLLAIQAAETRPSFVEWIKQGSGKVQSAYEEVESESTCLQVITAKNCRCYKDIIISNNLPTCVDKYYEVKLSCCESLDGEKYSHYVEDLIAQKLSVGSCSISQQYFDKEITYHVGSATKIGTFSGTCELTEKSGQCGSPLCEGMTLVITGDILRYGKVAFMHDLDYPDLEGDCELPLFRPPVYPPTTPAPAPKTPAKVQYSKGGDDDGDGDKTNFLVGQGDIYSGTFSVVSRYHKTPYKVGTYQLVTATGLPGSYKSYTTPPEKCYVAKDGAAALDFLKSGGNY